jgi:hypothetical protein
MKPAASRTRARIASANGSYADSTPGRSLLRKTVTTVMAPLSHVHVTPSPLGATSPRAATLRSFDEEAALTNVYLEAGRTSVFAVSLDWPGWCRRARTDQLALEELERYAPRYAAIVGDTFRPGPLEVVGTLAGNRTTDFGAPAAIGPWDERPAAKSELERAVALLQACWRHFDGVAARSPEALRKGPRGGGRDRDAVAEHVREAERAYCAKVGARVAPRTPWTDQRATLAAALAGDASGAWPLSYATRRIAWHVTDHAWEIEDRRP